MPTITRRCVCGRCKLCGWYDRRGVTGPAVRESSAAPPRRSPCIHLGPIESRCPHDDPWRHLHRCDSPRHPYAQCKPGGVCQTCPAWEAAAPVLPPPGWPIRFDEKTLWPGVPGLRFNCSILPDGDGYLFAARNGWRGSEIYIGRLDAAFAPVGEPAKLDLFHKRDAAYGREDVRLFRHKGRPHVAYIGVVGGRRIRHTNQLFARLSADGIKAEEVFSPVDYPTGREKSDRPQWQKNWQFFDVADHLYAVYTINPHRVIRVRSNHAELAYETPGLPGWQGGEPRGGASPVLVGDEWWSFFHDRITGPDGKLQYRTNLYTFDAAPPFAIRRYIPEPILSADHTTRPEGQYASVVFPGGSVRVGDDWVITSGEHDRWSRLDRFSHADLSARLIDVSPRAVREPITGDVLLAACLVGGLDEFESGIKVRGTPCTTADLSPAELSRYIRPFSESCRRWQVQGIVLHDGLPAEVIESHPWLTFSRVNPSGVNNFDRRWFAWRDWLDMNDVSRAWLVDVNDVLFTTHPFAWLDSRPGIVVSTEPQTYASNPWFADHLPHLPDRYGAGLLRDYGDCPPPCCGSWAADRTTAATICRAVCAALVEIETHLGDHPPPHQVCRDMAAFGRVLLDGYAPRLWRVTRRDGPLIHDLAIVNERLSHA